MTKTKEQQAETAIREHGARIIGALESAWAAIQAKHPEVPGVVIITGSGHHQKGTQAGWTRLGHHWPERWVDGKKRVPELFVAGELLAQGGRAVLQTMLHEASHALAHVRGIKDCSAEGNRWHNRKFAALATELGLQSPARAEKVIGFSNAVITDETGAAYEQVVAAINAERLPYLDETSEILRRRRRTGGTDGDGDGEDGGEGTKPRRGGKRLAVQCGCEQPRKTQVTVKFFEDGPVLCGLCGQQFAPVNPDDLPESA